ncbi:uncharacterized protein LOC123550897 isoform X2 [Mercenaria mercenaria]|uniref:uncharacterized protein LOC123550897 isoform X2 n=1 Tax=Mercenaria mercenaria TaxID=6596 RepID=UPI00234F70E9|nr:uncharacterized protein LOC123550897 isoform X2 [Mercenaria mercenaria]
MKIIKVGEINYKEWISSYKKAKKEYLQKCAEKGINIDPNFVGREVVLEDVLKYLREEFKGVVLCGISGMGKTSLANQVCGQLMYSKPAWKIIIINQREKSELNELLVELISELSEELCIEEHMQLLSETNTSHLRIQCSILMQELIDRQSNMLILLDNIDGHCDGSTKQNEFCQFMKEILHKIPLTSNVKFLLTVGKKLSNITKISNERNFLFDKQMVEQELKPLTGEDTARVLRKISHKSEKDLPGSVCDGVHSICGGIPFSVSMVGDLIKNGFTADKLLSGLQRQPQTVPMDTFLQKSFQMLETSPQMHELKTLLVRFSVFQTARFNIQAAVSVGFDTEKEVTFRRPGMSVKDPTLRDNMWIKLQQLKSHFLLEVDDAFSSLGRKKRSAEKLYSLHPLVAKYVMSLCREDENLRLERESAKFQFLKHYCTEIEKLGESSDKDPLIARNIMDANMVHIKQFFNIIRQEATLLTKYLPQKDPNKHRKSSSVAVQRRRIWKIADWAISSLERKLFARRQAELEKEGKNLFSYIYWRSLEAESLLTQDRIQQTLQLLDGVTSELGIVTDDTVCSKVDGWNQPPDEEIPAWATFYMVKGRLYFMKSRNNNEKVLHERAMDFLTIAEKLFEGQTKSRKGEVLYSRKYFQTDLADVKNLEGCVFFLMKLYEKSMPCHEAAYNLILKLTGNQLHKNLTEYRSNVAACYHQLALDTDKPEDTAKRSMLFQKALKFYDQSVRNNKQMRCEMMPSQAGTLRNRAEIYYKQELLEKALEDGKHVLKIVRNLYVPPHIEITLALERLAHYHLKIGKKKQKELDVDGQDHLEKAMQYYDEVLMQITNGGLPIENNDARTYRHVRDNHIKVMKLLRYEHRLIEDRVKDYQAFEEGKYNKSIQHNLQHDLDFVPAEFLKKAIEEGAVFVPHKMDDSDSESSETSSSEASHSSSSSKSSSRGAESPNRMMDVDQVIALKRQDSGLEETEMSDEELRHTENSEVVGKDSEKFEKNDMEIDMEGGKIPDRGNLIASGSEEDSVFDKRTDTESKRKTFRKKSSSSLTRQASIDLPDVVEVDESQGDVQVVELREPSTSSFTDSARGSWSSSVSTSSFDSHRRSSTNDSRESWRGSRLSASFGSQKCHETWSSTASDDSTFSGAQKRRENFSNTGSQDSVTSQMGRLLCLEDLEENVDDDAVDKPTAKRKKTDHQ